MANCPMKIFSDDSINQVHLFIQILIILSVSVTHASDIAHTQKQTFKAN